MTAYATRGPNWEGLTYPFFLIWFGSGLFSGVLDPDHGSETLCLPRSHLHSPLVPREGLPRIASPRYHRTT